MGKRVVIVGGGIIGLCAAYYCAQRGWRVTLVDRNAERRDGCSFGNAGMLVTSHFVPLAAPGMVALALKWMWNPASPFYVKPRLSPDLLAWGYRFWRAATPEHVRRAAPLLRDLSEASHRCLRRTGGAPGQRLRPRAQRAPDAVPHAACARRGSRHGRNGSYARHRVGGARRQRGGGSRSRHQDGCRRRGLFSAGPAPHARSLRHRTAGPAAGDGRRIRVEHGGGGLAPWARAA